MKTKKQKKWEKQNSKIGLGLTLTILIMSLLAPLFQAGGSTSQVNAVISITTSCNFAPSNTAINFGSLAAGTNTIGTVSTGYNTINIVNTGSTISNILVSGSNWNYNANTFTVTNTIWNSQNGNTVWNPLVSSHNSGTANVEIELSGTTTDTLLLTSNSAATNTLFFGVNAPSTQLSGSYAQTINMISNC